MKCKRCGKKITWDNSFGKANNLICYACLMQSAKTEGSEWKALKKLFEE